MWVPAPVPIAGPGPECPCPMTVGEPLTPGEVCVAEVSVGSLWRLVTPRSVSLAADGWIALSAILLTPWRMPSVVFWQMSRLVMAPHIRASFDLP